MLDCHPSIGWVNEFEYAVDMVPPENGWPDIAEYVSWLETHRIFRRADLEIRTDRSYCEVMNDFLRQWKERKGKRLIGATVHRHFDRLLRIWPNARFRHVVRDGRDVAASNVRMGWAGHLWYGVDRWIDAERLWERMRNDLSEDRFFEFRFEDLITEPTLWLGKICDFLGVERHSTAMLSYPESTSYSYPDSRLLYQWKKKMSPRHVELLESRIGGMLSSRGYTLMFPEARAPGALRRGWQSIQNRVGKAMFARKRFGTGLCLGAALARRFGSQELNKRMILKKNEIVQRHLK